MLMFGFAFMGLISTCSDQPNTSNEIKPPVVEKTN
jgi:hypothetical protein